MANCSLLIHPITSLPPNRTTGRLTLAQFMDGFNNLTKAVSGKTHGDSWPFLPHFFRRFLGRKIWLPQYYTKVGSLSIWTFFDKCRYVFFHGMMVVSSKLYVVCFLHFKGYHLPGPGYPIPLCSSLWLPKLWEATYDTQASDTFYSDRGVTLQSLEITKFVA